MNRLLSLIIVLGFASFSLACDPPNEGASKVTEPPTTPEASMSLAYVSAHLGSTWDCAEPGVRIGPTTAESPADMGSAGAAAPSEAGDCLDSNCGPMNCESGSIMVQIQNTGDTELSGLEVTDLQLLQVDGTELAELPVEAVTLVEGSEVLADGDTTTIRVEFKAPHSGDIYQEDALKLRIIIVSDEGADAEIITPEVQTLPIMAT